MQQFFLKKLVLLFPFRGQKMREPRPAWSSLGVNFKILDERPYPFYILSPPPPPSWNQYSREDFLKLRYILN